MEMGNVSSSLEHVNKHGNTVFKVKKMIRFPPHVSLVDSRSRCICQVFVWCFLSQGHDTGHLLWKIVENLKGLVLRCNFKNGNQWLVLVTKCQKCNLKLVLCWVVVMCGCNTGSSLDLFNAFIGQCSLAKQRNQKNIPLEMFMYKDWTNNERKAANVKRNFERSSERLQNCYSRQL